MLRTENLQNEKIMSALEELGLGGGELEAAEKYLKDEAGEEVLAGITFRDMAQMPLEKTRAFDALFSSCYKKKRYEDAVKLFNLVYAVGGSTCCVCFRYIYDFSNVVRTGVLKIDRARALAVYIQYIASNSHQISAYTLKAAAANFAESDPLVVLQAYREYKGQYSNGQILLLTLYFYLRCDQKDLATGAKLQRKRAQKSATALSGQQAEGVLGGIKKLFGGKSQSDKTVDGSPEALSSALNLGEEILDERDKELLKEYEEKLVGPLGMIFSPDASKEPQISEIQRQIFKGILTPERLRGICDRAVNTMIFGLLGGCAYVNYMLSEKLRSVVMVCSAADPIQMMKVIDEMDMRQELEHCGGELQDLFGIPGRNIISWAADRLQKGLTHRTVTNMDLINRILQEQFCRHKAEFIEEYKKAGYQAADAMARIIKEGDPDLYKKEVLQNGDAQRDKVIELLTSKGTFSRECRDYLEGRTDLSTIYAIRNQFTPYYGAYDGKMALEQYVRTFHDEAFYGRCVALMALRGTSYFFTTFSASPVDEKKEFQKELQHIFQSMTYAGVGLADQIQVVGLMVDNTYDSNRKQAISQACISIFQQYLAERTQEMVDAFAGAGADGRYFALLVYGSEAKLQITEENRETCRAALDEF